MNQIAFRYGLLMFLGLTGFFLLLNMFHLNENYYLHILNGTIHLGILWLALNAWSRRHHDGASDITSGVVLGMFTSFIGVIPFSIFMAIFLALDPEFLARIRSQTPLGEYLTPMTSCLFILVEAVVLSLIGSYIILRILDARRERA